MKKTPNGSSKLRPDTVFADVEISEIEVSKASRKNNTKTNGNSNGSFKEKVNGKKNENCFFR